MPLFFRFIADFFWEYKTLSIVLNFYALYHLMTLIAINKFQRKIPIKESFILGTLFIVLLNSYFIRMDETSLKIFFKITFSLFLFFIGIFCTTFFKEMKWLTLLCTIFLVIEFILAFTNNGFKYWGDTKTFSGFYYFKTDLALSIVISLLFFIYFSKYNSFVKYSLILISIYIVYLSNSRIHLLTIFLVVSFFFTRHTLLKNIRLYFFVLLPIILASFFLFNFIISSLNLTEKKSYLTINVSNFYTAENTQGRDQIWRILLEKFKVADLEDKLLGLGLSADVTLNDKFAENKDSNNAHNNYLFLLIAMGFSGSLLFYLFSVLCLSRFIKLARKYYTDEKRGVLLLMFFSHFVIFFITSFSSSVLIFQQETWFFMFFAGIIYNPKYFEQNNILKHEDTDLVKKYIGGIIPKGLNNEK